MTAPLCCQNPEFLRQKRKATGVGNTPVSAGKTDTGECELPNTEFQTYSPVMGVGRLLVDLLTRKGKGLDGCHCDKIRCPSVWSFRSDSGKKHASSTRSEEKGKIF